jgi:hypothetical protein
MGVPEIDVFVDDGNGQVVRTLDTSDTGLLMPLFAAGEPPVRAGVPFPTGPYAKGTPLGVTLGHWLEAVGTGNYTRCDDVATIDISFEHLTPNAVYTMWCYSYNATVENEVPCGDSEGTENTFMSDEHGQAHFTLTVNNFLADDPTLNYGVAAVYHSDGQTYGSTPGDWGVNVHFHVDHEFQLAEN